MQIILSSCKIFRATREDGKDRFEIFYRPTEERIGTIGKSDIGRWIFAGVFIALSSTELMDLSCLVSTCRLTAEPSLDPFTDSD